MAKSKNKKTAVPVKSKLKKDPGIPRLPNLKVRVGALDKRRAPTPLVCARTDPDPDALMASEPTLSSLAQLAASPPSPATASDDHSSPEQTKEQARRHYIRTLHKVIDQSDVIVLVLDARDPEGCRSRLVEEEVRRRENEGKKLVFVLNKIDLVPRSNTQAWLRYLRHTTPTLPFRSAASTKRTHLSSRTAPSLLRLLKAYKPGAQSITVGVVGYPNVGKSSLINSMKRAKVCAVAAQPGHTKSLQSIQLERGIRILDSPGVVFDEDMDIKGIGSSKGSVLLRNVVRVEDVEDPIAVVEEILARTDAETLQKIYDLNHFGSTLEFLTMLSLTTGRLLKGGTPDILTSARHVITDWNRQKIPYFSTPPAIHPSSIPSTIPSSSADNPGVAIAPGAENVGHAQILNAFSKPFELEGLFGAADASAFGSAQDGEGKDEVMADADGDVWWDAQEGMDEDSQDKEMADDEFGVRSMVRTRKRTRSPSPTTVAETIEYPARKRRRRLKDDGDTTPHPQMAGRGPMSRAVLKRERKRTRRAARNSAREEAGGMDVDVWEGIGGVLEGVFNTGTTVPVSV